MYVFLLLLILLVFPILEIWLLIQLAHMYGWFLLAYLLVITLLGWRLILNEKLLIFNRISQSMIQGGNPIQILFGGAKNMVAGILLIIPGVISDALAVILLLLPASRTNPLEPNYKSSFKSSPRSDGTGNKAANDDVIEGEFRRED